MHGPSILEDLTAERILSILLSGAFRRNSLARMDADNCRADLLTTLSRRTKRDLPIAITVLAFPFKVPNPAKVGERTLPDFAEFSSIRHLSALRDAIKKVYPPGLEFHILHDGLLLTDVVGITRAEVCRYEKYFSTLIEVTGASHFIRCYDFCSLQRQCGFAPYDAIDQLRSEAHSWWELQRGSADWRARFRKTLGLINLRHLPAATVANLLDYAKSGRLPPSWGELQKQVHRAMITYHIADAIIHRFDPRPCCFPDAIHATTQDRPGRLSIWMVRRGQSLLPWHGVGCLDDRFRPRVLYAAQVSDIQNCTPLFLTREETPFVYMISEPRKFR